MTRVLTLAACLLAAGASGWSREPRVLRLQWNQLAPHIAHKKVAFVLPDGTHVEGKVNSVEPDGLRMNVTKTSNKAALRKGNQLVPRAGLSLLRVTGYGWTGRLLVPLGAAGLAAGIVLAQNIDASEGLMVIVEPAILAAGVTGSAVGGYYVGKRIDRRITQITIVPDAGSGGTGL